LEVQLRKLLVSVFILGSASIASAFSFPIAQCNITPSSDQQALLKLVYDRYTEHASTAWHDNQDICPVHFSVAATNKFECKFSDFGREYSLDPAVATMAFRDSGGDLYSVSYKACLSKGSEPTKLDKDFIEVHRVKDGTVYKRFVVREADVGNRDNNDKNCDTNRIVTQTVCAPPNYKVYAWGMPVPLESSRDSGHATVAPSENPACVVVTFLLKGQGYAEVGGIKVSCNEHAKFMYDIELKAYTSQDSFPKL
jgi:hypothetical protein